MSDSLRTHRTDTTHPADAPTSPAPRRLRPERCGPTRRGPICPGCQVETPCTGTCDTCP